MANRYGPGRRRSSLAGRGRRLLSTEQLEERTLMHADPVGGNMLISDAAVRAVAGAYRATDVSLSDRGGAIVYHGIDRGGHRDEGNGREIVARRLNADGTPLGDLFRVNSLVHGEQSNPQVASDGNGNLLVVWDGRGAGDLQGIFARRFAVDGTPLGEQFRVNAEAVGVQSQPQVAMNAAGAAVVVWQGASSSDAAGVFARRLSATGQPTGSDILVNTTVAGEQAFADVALDSAGNFVVAWGDRSGTTDWDVQFQRFDAAGNRQGTETRANTHTAGSQFRPAIASTEVGDFIVGWSSFRQDGDGWGVYARQFDDAGEPLTAELQLPSTTAGHQRDLAIAVAGAGDYLASWTHGQPDGRGWEVHAKVFHADGDGSGEVFTVNDTASHADRGDQQLPAAAINSEGTTVVAFQFSGGRTSGVSSQRYEIDVEPPANVAPELTQVSDQAVNVTQQLQVDVTASDGNRRDVLTFRLDSEQSPAGATITKTGDRTARVTWQPTAADRNRRVPFRVLVDDNGQPSLGDAMQFFVNVQNIAPVVDLNGSAAGVDRTATLAEGETTVALADSQLTVTDGDQAALESATVTINTILDGSAESLQVDTSGTSISQSYNSATGALLLTGADSVANYERVLRTLRYQNTATPPAPGQRRVEVTVHDGTARSPAANIMLNVIGPNAAPTLAELPEVTILAGSPLHIPLDAEDANGDNLTFTVTSSDPALVSPRVLTGNRSLRMNVANFGEMVLELFEDRAPRATQQIIALANEGFYNGIIFHRVVGDFVIQAGDPTGTGSSGSSRPNFDDQFHFELQHNRTGVLSMAKSTDDTNNSQFFITEGAQRHLDFNHTVFGQLVEGESVREAISSVAVNADSKPLTDVRISSMEVFTDNENGVVMLDSPMNATGSATITVQVSDGRGGTVTRQFVVNVRPDTINGSPFLADIPAVQTEVNTPTTFQLAGRDVEGDPVFFLDEDGLSSRGLFLPVASHPDMDYSVNPTTGLVAVTPRNNLRGTFNITVAAAASLTNLNASSPIDYQVVRVTVGVVPT